MKQYIKLFEEFTNKEKIYSGKFVANYIKEITPDESDIPDYFIEKLVLLNKFIRKNIIIKDLLKTDINFKDYYESGEERYDQDEMNYDDLDYPVVIVDDQVIDGYSRLSYFLKNDIEDVIAYVNIPKE